MNGEDKIFLLQVIHAVRMGGDEMAKFLLNTDNIDRVLRIKKQLGKDGFDRELIKMREVIYEEEN